jgi:ABC-2 type transport system permease protein
MWLLIPVIAAALDDTVDPLRLQLLPIPNLRLAAGLLAAAIVGPGTVATSLTVAGGVVAYARPGFAVLLQFIAGLVMVAWCLVSARLLTTILSSLLRSRRGRDLVAIVGPLIGVSALALQSWTAQRAQDGFSFPRFLWVTPPGALARAVEEFSGGLLPGLLFLSYGVATTAGVVVWFGHSLERLATKSPISGRPGQVGNGNLVRGFGRWLSGLRLISSQAAAVAAKEARGMRRDPRLRAQFIGLGIAVLVLTTGLGRQLVGTELAPLIAVAGAFIGVNAVGFNVLGMDDKSFWAYVASGVPWREVLAGKNLAIFFLSGTVTAILAVVGLFVGGTPLTFLIALFSGAAVALVWVAVGNNVSVLGAFPMPESNLFGSRNLPGGVFLPSILGLMIAGALTLPLGALVALPWLWLGPGFAFGGALLSLVLAVTVYRLGLKTAVGQLVGRAPRLLEILDGR